MKVAHKPMGVRLILSSTLGLLLTFGLTAVAYAQTPFDTQYGDPAGSGNSEKMSCSKVVSSDDLLNAGDKVTYPGNFSVSPGSSVVLDDADGTQGTLIDGKNAQISESSGNIVVSVTGDPINVGGGSTGALDDTVCHSIVSSTGISSGGSADDPSGLIGGLLPDTGGPLLPFVALGILVLGGTGLLALRKYNH